MLSACGGGRRGRYCEIEVQDTLAGETFGAFYYSYVGYSRRASNSPHSARYRR